MSDIEPQRMTLVNMRTQDERVVQFNPSELEEKLNVKWTRASVPGLSYEPLQYQGTGNHRVTLELYCEAHDEDEKTAIRNFRNFILSLCYPSVSAADVIGGAPPRVLFVWPGMFTFAAIIEGEVTFRHVRFSGELESTRYTAIISLEEIRDVRLSSEEVLQQGTLRTTR